MNEAFLNYYRCPQSAAGFVSSEPLSGHNGSGYFKFGPDVTCYGRSSVAVQPDVTVPLLDCLKHVRIEESNCYLPFNPTEVAENLRRERYISNEKSVGVKRLVRQIYYALRPVFPVAIRRHLQRLWLKGREQKPFPHWPVDRTVDQMFEKLMYLALKASPEGVIPFVWFWPEGRSSCAVMTHDVETVAGLDFSSELMDINDSLGIKSSFQLIPDARYTVGYDTISMFKKRGFEVNVHDLKHDGHLFDGLESFRLAAQRINQFASDFDSKGFRAGALYRNQEWFVHFNISYDMSVPNVGHLDPQPGGCCTVMPYFIDKILEIPVTMTQDYSLFNVIGTYCEDLWLEQINLIMQQYGLISFIVHPDYLDSSEARNAYMTLLRTLAKLRETSALWIALPGEVDSWWRQRNEMNLVTGESGWSIEGRGSERARVAYARLNNDQVVFTFA
jgi:hypothetical protein